MRRRRADVLTLAACAAVLGVLAGLALSGGGSLRGRHWYAGLTFGHDPYRYAVYVPPHRRSRGEMPLVVVLHGCTMTTEQEAAASGYDRIAAAKGFVVLYPEVDAVDRAVGQCWKGIWDPGAEGRGRGDAGAIAAMTRAVIARWRIDPSRVYVIGISAGGFETAILGAVYPDLYAAIGIHSGVAYLGGEPGCLPDNESPGTTNARAQAALAAMGAHARVMPVIVFHGDLDGKIPYRCGQQALAQWIATDNLALQGERRELLPPTPAVVSHRSVTGQHAYTVLSYAAKSGCPVAQLWTIHGMGHYWSGGSADPIWARYSDPRGPNASAASWAFFSHWRLSGATLRCR
jgi:poly(hydroxyalkanoate) depolymerase family esterase